MILGGKKSKAGESIHAEVGECEGKKGTPLSMRDAEAQREKNLLFSRMLSKGGEKGFVDTHVVPARMQGWKRGGRQGKKRRASPRAISGVRGGKPRMNGHSRVRRG